jgi:hypothetical protein
VCPVTRTAGASYQIKTAFDTSRSLSPHNYHHASPEREKPTVDKDWDSISQYRPFPSHLHPRTYTPLVLLSQPFRESSIATLPSSLDSHRRPPLSPSASNFLIFKKEPIVAPTTVSATSRSHLPGIHSSFAFRSCLVTGMGYGHRMPPLRTKRIS